MFFARQELDKTAVKDDQVVLTPVEVAPERPAEDNDPEIIADVDNDLREVAAENRGKNKTKQSITN